jgi:nitrogen fixation/metabolism regulation signal transduction histidine kinase
VSLRSRLIVAFLALALVPLAIVTLFALDRLTHATRLWNTPSVEHALGSALDVSRTALTRMEASVRGQAESWAQALPDEPIDDARRAAVRAALPATALDFVQVYRERDGRWRREENLVAVESAAAAVAPGGGGLAAMPDLSDRIGEALAGERVVRAREGALVGIWPAGAGRVVAAGYRVPNGFFAGIERVDTGAAFYRRFGVVSQVTRVWLLLLVTALALALTAISVVAATRLAAGMTRPLRELETAVGRVASGDLDARVTPSGARELATLGDRFNTMAVRLADAREAMARAEREAAWREIARRLAHEFKNLLTPMSLSMHRLRRRVDAVRSEDRDAVIESLASIDRAVDQLARLAEQFAQYARLPEPRPEPIDLADVVRSAVGLVDHEGVRVTVGGTATLPVTGDALLLGRAIHNLVLNACEATPAGGEVEVRWAGAEGVAEVEVLDRGHGLAPEVRERLFEPYVSTKRRGSGLGLSLVRDIAGQHGGTVTLADRPGGGARAVLRMPLGSGGGAR